MSANRKNSVCRLKPFKTKLADESRLAFFMVLFNLGANLNKTNTQSKRETSISKQNSSVASSVADLFANRGKTSIKRQRKNMKRRGRKKKGGSGATVLFSTVLLLVHTSIHIPVYDVVDDRKEYIAVSRVNNQRSKRELNCNWQLELKISAPCLPFKVKGELASLVVPTLDFAHQFMVRCRCKSNKLIITRR